MNFENYRKLFPVTDKYIYLDHAGVGPVSTRVKDAICSFAESASNEGVFAYDEWMDEVETTRKNCASLVGASAEEIAFVKSTSHGISIVASGLEWSPGDNVLVYEKEFPSNIYPWLSLERKGVEIRYLKADAEGRIGIEEIEQLADDKTRLISISSVQYSTGFKADLEKIGNFCSDNSILFFVDAIQSLGLLPMDVKKFSIDFLAADGHKWMLAPEGIGIFYCSKNNTQLLNPPILGWNSVVDESNYGHINFQLKDNAMRFEEGSLNVLGIFALDAAVSLLLEAGINNVEKRVKFLGNLVIESAEERRFDIVSPHNEYERGGIVLFTGNFDKENLRDRLQEKGIMVNYRGGAIRVSPHFYNNENEIDKLFKAVDSII